MGFDGYYQRICDQGHYYISDALSEMFGGPEACTQTNCDSVVIVAENLVDTTNGCEFNNKPCCCGAKHVLFDGNKAIGFGDDVIHQPLEETPPRRIATYRKPIK